MVEKSQKKRREKWQNENREIKNNRQGKRKAGDTLDMYRRESTKGHSRRTRLDGDLMTDKRSSFRIVSSCMNS
jgi:hypothetical protein